jgi:pyruvate kinase
MKETTDNPWQLLLDQVMGIILHCLDQEAKEAEVLARVHPAYRLSAANLVHYKAVRQSDIRKLQARLGNLGISRLGKAEAHMMASLYTVHAILQSFQSSKQISPFTPPVSIKLGNKLLEKHTKHVLGYKNKSRRVRIMVTLPTEAADHYPMVLAMMKAGMNSARINCAHDGPVVWKKMVAHVRKASEETGLKCTVCMDLAGPKIRTGEMVPGTQVVKIRPQKDHVGQVISPATVWLVPDGMPPVGSSAYLPVTASWLQQMEEGDVVTFKDARNKKRNLQVVRQEGSAFLAHAFETSYIVAGTILHLRKISGHFKDQVGALPPVAKGIILKKGDALEVHQANRHGEPAIYSENGKVISHAHIPCTSDEVFRDVRPGEMVLFDDGKFAARITSVGHDHFMAEITQCPEGGGELKPDKGINFPDSQLTIRGLTPKDLQDFAFVAKYADVVNVSFVNHPDDVEDILSAIRQHGATDKLGVILKIETKAGFMGLTNILLKAMQLYPVGVMIARGDLAVECGWENMSWIQEEILSVCQAAHIPVIWATQVLENLAKKGVPSRAEITDAAMAQRAECVMLNKGPHIVTAITMLSYILTTMKQYQHKKATMLPRLNDLFAT